MRVEGRYREQVREDARQATRWPGAPTAAPSPPHS